MKILCLNPPFKTECGRFSRSSRSPAITKSGTLYYPIWLCYVAGVLEASGFQVKVIDSCAYEYDLAATLKLVHDFQPQLCVVDTSTPSIYADVQTGAEIKKILPHCLVALMGTHPTALPEETLGLNEAIDAVVVGEADYIVRDLAQGLAGVDLTQLSRNLELRQNLLGQIQGLAFRAGSQITVNPPRPLISDLDELPWVSQVYKRHLDPGKYFFAASDYPEVQIMTARGCIARCSFCVYPQTIHGYRYRTRTPENVAEEFAWINQHLPEVREIGIEDDTFTGDQKRVIRFCQELLQRQIKIKWYCNVRADLRLETMQWMKKAGCALAVVGYESANPVVLKNINKRITPEMIFEFSRNTQQAGLLVHGCFMAGNRGESRQTLEETLNLALGLMDDTVQFFPLMVYPGTQDFDWARRENLLTIRDYSDYVTPEGFHNSVLRMPDMTSQEIREWCDYARRKYYLRPKYLLYKMLQQIKTPAEMRRTFKAAKRFIRFLR
jgi:radical SAM superfamily enzyme YgiQ (UPF0313 family)